MNHLLTKISLKLLFIFPCVFGFSAEETFLLINGQTQEKVIVFGPRLHERMSPCSSFKIPLCLIGYDSGILINTDTPRWEYQEGYDDFLESWKEPQTPQSWMQSSCLWFSKVLSLELGLEKLSHYVTAFEYGNQDLSGGLAQPGPAYPAWIRSSLEISPEEQVHFVQKMLQKQLPVSDHALSMTKQVLFKEDLTHGWKLFGKTGWSGSMPNGNLQHSWFVGWIEKEDLFFPFAYLIRDGHIDLAQRIPRVKQLIHDANILK